MRFASYFFKALRIVWKTAVTLNTQYTVKSTMLWFRYISIVNFRKTILLKSTIPENTLAQTNPLSSSIMQYDELQQIIPFFAFDD